MRALVLIACFSAACGAQSTAPRLGENIVVRFNEAVRIPSDTTTVRFAAVTSDSRCPSGAQCVWAGEATVVFTVGGVRPVTLGLQPGSVPSTAIVGMYQITLVALTPYPAVNKSIAKSDYVATIRFDSARD